MYSGQQAFPSVTPGFGSTAPSTSFGLTVEQVFAAVFMHALLSNVNYRPGTYDELAQSAKDAATALINKLP